MTRTQDPLTTSHDDAQLLWDLARISGTLSEITTAWRRARPFRPELPLILPEQLHGMARRLAAGIRALGDAGQVQSADLVLYAAGQFSALREGITSAQAMTCGPGVPQVGDDRLWESLQAPLQRAGTQLARPVPHPVPAAD